MACVFFDLDHTLIAGDSDYLWGQFLVDQHLVDAQNYQQMNTKFYEDYKRGKLNYDEYLKFSLAPLAKYETEQLLALNHDFIETCIRPIIYPQSLQLIKQHKDKGDRLIIHSSTNSFIVSPIAYLLGVSETISTKLEIIGDQYTGKYIGLPNYGQNKVKNTYVWLKQNQLPYNYLQDSTAYSDSFTDIPLLKMCDHPVVVNADETLRDYALSCGWQIMDFQSYEQHEDLS